MKTKTTILIENKIKGFKGTFAKLLLLVVVILGFQNLSAQVTTLQNWTNLYHASGSGTTSSYTVPTGSNSNRVLAVAISSSQNATAPRSVSITYGGQTMTLATGNMGINSIRQHTAIYYLNEAGLDAATNSDLVYSVTGGTTIITTVWAAVFDYVDQTNSITNSRNYDSANTNTTTFAFGTALTINSNDQAVLVIGSNRIGSNTPRTISSLQANFTSVNEQTDIASSDALRDALINRSVPTSNTTSTCSTTMSGTSLVSMTGVSFKGCVPATANAGLALSAICAGFPSVGLGGSVGGSATGGIWSDGGAGGTFLPNATTLNATWTAPANYSGTATLTLTTTGGSCGVNSASKTIVVNPTPTATGVTICQNGSGSLTSSYVCASTAPLTTSLLAGSGVNNGSGTAWSNAGNVTANDANQATVSATGGLFNNTSITSQLLQATNFGFAIPANATISAIEVTISRFRSGNGSASDNSIVLLKNGSTVGNNAAAGGNWSTTETAANYTGTGTLWGAGLSVSDINNSSFGVAIAANVTGNLFFQTATANINYVQIAITYTVPGSLNWYTASSGGSSFGSGSPFNPVGVLNSGLANTTTPGTTTFYAECSTTPGCRTPVNFVITPTTSITIQPTAPVAICSGSGTQSLSVVATGTGTINYSWRRAGVPVVNGAIFSGQGTATLTLTNATTADAGNYDVVVSSSCGSVTSNLITITVNPKATSSVISGSAAICSGSTTNLQVAITGGTSPYTVVYSGGTVNGYTSGSNIPISPTSTTAYTLTSVTDANGCVGTGNSGTATVSIDSTTSTNGGLTWSNGTPNATKSVLFDGATGTIGADFDACSLRLTNNAIVTVSSGFDVTLNGRLTVDAGSTFTLNNNANLLQNSTLTNSGSIVVKRNTSALKRLDYTLWASPVSGQGIYAFTPLTFANRFYAYRTNTNVFNNADVGLNVTGLDANSVNGTDANSVPFAQAKGYLIRMPWNHPTTGTVWNGSFTGVPNNGNINYTMTNGGSGKRFNLVGNPYPSPIDAVAFVSNSNNNTTTTGTLYFWRKTNNALSPSYCIWTLGGFVSNGEAQVFDPNDVIQTGQGFFVEGSGNGSGTVNFDNTMRIDDHANQFFRTTATNTTTTTLERNRIWLNATNATGLFSQAMVGYITNATQGIDAAIDGKYINDGDIALTSLINDVPYAIQGRALPFDSSDIVPMSFKATTAGNYTIAIDHVDGIFTGGAQSIYLKDNLTTTIHDLNAGAYTFTSDAGTFNNRFEVVYQTQLSNPVFTVNAVVIYSQNNEFVVNSGNFTMSSIKVFDVRGRLLEEKKGINANETIIKGGLANQVLLVQITTEDGIVVTKKVIR